MSIQKAVDQALAELDTLGDSAIRKQILGLGQEEEKKPDEPGEEEKLDPSTEAALLEALSK